MPVTSVVIEINDGVSEEVLGRLARVPKVNVFGVKENQIVTVIEGESTEDVEETVKAIMALDGVVGVFPVYAGDYD